MRNPDVTSSQYLNFLVLSQIFLTIVQFLNQAAHIKLIIHVVNRNPLIHIVKGFKKFDISKYTSSCGLREFQTPHIVPVKELYDSRSICLQIVNAVKQRVDVAVQMLLDDVNFRRVGIEPIQEGFAKLVQVRFGAQR